MKLLADTSALLALVLPDDEHHEAASRYARNNPNDRFVLTELILGEVVTRLRARSDAARAVAFAGDILRSRRYDLVFADTDLLRGALEQMNAGDKRLLTTARASNPERLGLDGPSRSTATSATGYRMLPLVVLPPQAARVRAVTAGTALRGYFVST